MIRQLFGGLSLAMAIFISSHGAVAQHGQTSAVVGDYFRMVFSGDLSGAEALFANNPDDHGTRMLEGQFKGRFIDRTGGADLSRISSPKVREIARLYQAYWVDALMRVAPLEQLDNDLKTRLDDILTAAGYQGAAGDGQDDEDRLLEDVAAFIRGEGYFALTGKTPPLLELMIWTKNEVTPQTVELTDGTVEVDVNFVDDLILYGWPKFATFGMAGTGGWATTEGLNCLCANYDLDSEAYELLFLKHETRHYADFALYPQLKAPDLEYRAKLTELAYFEQGIYGRLKEFTNGAMKIDNAPHPLANWYVVEGLTDRLLDGQWPADATVWEGIPRAEIRQAATELLLAHNQQLNDQGAAVTTGVIMP